MTSLMRYFLPSAPASRRVDQMKYTRLPERIRQQDGINFAKGHGMLFLECSAKTRAGITQAFEELVQKVHPRNIAI